jgi:hypothetical protein
MAREVGQATVEALAAIALLLLTGALALQLLLAGYSLTLVDGAAEAGALALADGRSAAGAVRAALPEWAGARAAVSVEGGEVSVGLAAPSLLPGVGEALTVRSSAFARSAAR